MKKRKGARLITVNDINYEWFTGKSNTNIRRCDNRKSLTLSNTEVHARVYDEATEAWADVVSTFQISEWIKQNEERFL